MFWDLKGSLDAASILIGSSILNLKAFCGCVAVILLLSIGVDLIFKSIIDCSKIELAILLNRLVGV